MAFVGARVYHNAGQAVANNSPLALALNTERYDTDGFHDTATNNPRLTIPSGLGGYYHIFGHGQLDNTGGAGGYLAIRLNGVTFIVAQSFANQATPYANVSTDWALAAGDYVELVAYQNSGAARNVVALAAYSPEFGLRKVG